MWCRAVVAFVTLALSLLMTLRAAEAQPAQKVSRIGVLIPGTAADVVGARFTEVFRQALRDLGWVEGQQIVIEKRYVEGNLDRLPALVAELVRLPVDLLVTGGLASPLAAKHATTTIPIVFVDTADPIGNGLIASLARPGGNLTGIARDAGPGLFGKQLELLKDTVPTVSRVAILRGRCACPTRRRLSRRESGRHKG
jgi:putative tryptophan/tyrosine transport system substrate-binding protein